MLSTCSSCTRSLRYKGITNIFPERELSLRICVTPTRSHSAQSTSDPSSSAIIQIPRANVFRFGQANTRDEPVFKDLEWTVKEGDSWALVGPAGSEKSDFFSILMGYMRLSPPPPKGLYPFLSTRHPPIDVNKAISHVSFTSRPSFSASFSAPSLSASGGFFDYTARYGAMRDELKATLRETLFSEDSLDRSKVRRETGNELDEVEEVVERLDLKGLMDLPYVVLSNGQTRRARIARALLGRPELLLLDEPLTGLDPSHRAQLTSLLHDLHTSRKPRILMSLRPQDPLPDWITHVVLVDGHTVRTQAIGKDFVPSFVSGPRENQKDSPPRSGKTPEDIHRESKEKKELIVMKNVNVRYHDRHVLKNINWTIREGERWHLQGPNGSGKTTLLSLLTGSHPQSYSQSPPTSLLQLFSLPRRLQPTVTLQHLIGHVSPEIFAAFPRGGGDGGLNVREVVGTGFEGVFSYRKLTPEQDRRVEDVLSALAPPYSSSGISNWREFASTKFVSLPPGQQSLVLLLRALVSRPPLLILDEPFAGMDSQMIAAVKRYLRKELDDRTSVIFVSHWEDEVPWDADEVKRIRLVDGEAVVS